MTVEELNLPKNESLDDFVKRNEIRQKLFENVEVWTQQYCDAITQNYKEYHVRMLERNLSGDHPEYAQQQLDEIKNGTAKLMKFEIKEGKKYYKIVQMEFDTYQNRNEYREGSVHSFVDKNTGDVYKPASWRSPAKHVRFTFQKPEDIRFLLNPFNVTWTGGYLYMR